LVNSLQFLTDELAVFLKRSGERGYQTSFDGESLMSRIKTHLLALGGDETGGEVIEYAIVAGLISIAALTVIGTFGTKVLARWNSVNSSL
jgi:Flp pilus assembly pilin Flp